MLTVGSREKSCFTPAQSGCAIRSKIDQEYFVTLNIRRRANTNMMRVAKTYSVPRGVNITERTKK